MGGESNFNTQGNSKSGSSSSQKNGDGSKHQPSSFNSQKGQEWNKKTTNDFKSLWGADSLRRW